MGEPVELQRLLPVHSLQTDPFKPETFGIRPRTRSQHIDYRHRASPEEGFFRDFRVKSELDTWGFFMPVRSLFSSSPLDSSQDSREWSSTFPCQQKLLIHAISKALPN